MKPVYLYAPERALVEKLPDDIKKEFVVHDETLDFTDSASLLHTRLSLVRLHDPQLVSLRDQVQAGTSVLEASKSIQLADVDESDLSQLFFAMGPSLLTSLITGLLGTAMKDADFLSVASLAQIRHALLLSLQK